MIIWISLKEKMTQLEAIPGLTRRGRLHQRFYLIPHSRLFIGFRREVSRGRGLGNCRPFVFPQWV